MGRAKTTPKEHREMMQAKELLEEQRRFQEQQREREREWQAEQKRLETDQRRADKTADRRFQVFMTVISATLGFIAAYIAFQLGIKK